MPDFFFALTEAWSNHRDKRASRLELYAFARAVKVERPFARVSTIDCARFAGKNGA